MISNSDVNHGLIKNFSRTFADDVTDAKPLQNHYLSHSMLLLRLSINDVIRETY